MYEISMDSGARGVDTGALGRWAAVESLGCEVPKLAWALIHASQRMPQAMCCTGMRAMGGVLMGAQAFLQTQLLTLDFKRRMWSKLPAGSTDH